MNKTKECLIEKATKLLKECEHNGEDSFGNEICYLPISNMMAVIEQNIGDCKYEELLNHLQCEHYELNYNHIGQYSSIGTIEISIFNVLHNKITTYKIFIQELPDNQKYCRCSENDENYNIEHKCCGKDCDWEIPTMTVYKEVEIGTSSFSGIERDLWSYEEEFNKKHSIISTKNDLHSSTEEQEVEYQYECF